MPRPYEPYIPATIDELLDKLGSVMLSSPRFKDTSGYFPGRNINTEFLALKESLNVLRKRLGEERYHALVAMSDRMRAHFEADPEDKTDEAIKGRDIILEMENILVALDAAE